VLLPDPLLPTTKVVSPAGKKKLASSIARWLGFAGYEKVSCDHISKKHL
jgi:hypothetical protein